MFGDDTFAEWGTHVERHASLDGVALHEAVTAQRLRGWVDALEPVQGLKDEVSDLVILAWAALRQRAWFHHGTAIPAPKPGTLKPEMELRTEALPASGDYRTAVSRAAALFGIVGTPYLTAPAVAELSERVRADVAARSEAAALLVPSLERAQRELRVSEGPRIETARATAALLSSLRACPDRVTLLTTLAAASLPCTDVAASKSLSSATTVTAALNGYRWERLRPLLEAEGDDSAQVVLDPFRNVLLAEELTSAITPALQSAEDGLFAWLARRRPGVPPPPPGPDPVVSDERSLQSDVKIVQELQDFLTANPRGKVEVTWRLLP